MFVEGKKIVVFGMGKSGVSALKLLHKFNADLWAVSKGEPKSWSAFSEVIRLVGEERCFDEENSQDAFSQAELVILSPGIPKTHPALSKALAKGTPIWSEIELAYNFVPPERRIVALTGTNGKTTTVTLIGEAIRACGKSVFVGGNIGKPFCDYVSEGRDDEYIVLELSSFQLESIENFRPNLAIVMNIYPNHGERYDSVEDYAQAKFNITKNMSRGDHLIYTKNFELLNKWGKEQECKGFSFDCSKVDKIKKELKKKYNLKNFKLYGDHNIINLYFAVKSVELLEIEVPSDVQNVIDTFDGIPFRLQYVRCESPFVPFNDAKSTNWDAVSIAVKAVQDEEREVYLILGGQKRGNNDSVLPYVDFLKDKVSKIFLIGDTTEDLAVELEGKIPYEKSYFLQHVISVVETEQFKGVLLFSPGFPSFDQFENYVKRGEKFQELLMELWESVSDFEKRQAILKN